MKNKLILVLWCTLFCLGCTNLSEKEIPYLKRNEHGVVQLILDGKPFVMLAGEVMNSSASTLESMAPKWERFTKLRGSVVVVAI